MKMKIGLALLLLLFASVAMLSQTPEAPSTSSTIDNSSNPANVAGNSITSLLPDLDRLNIVAAQAASDIGRLHIEKWKANGGTKTMAVANADSVQRNLTSALPALIDAARSAPDDLNADFKLYRDLNALHDVFGTLTEASRVFGQKGDYEALAERLQVMDSVRRKLGEALEQLTAATQNQLNEMRIQIRNQQQQLAAAEAAAALPKEIVVAQTSPPKKVAPKKKTVAKKPATAASGSNANSPGSNSSDHAGTGTTVPKS
jgi:hypothetical protein